MIPTAEPLTLRLLKPFRIAHGTSHERTNALVRVGEGLGEAGLPPYLGTRYADVAAWVRGVRLPDWPADEPPPLQRLLAALPDGPLPARAALDLALHDLWGRRLGHPLYRLFGLDPDDAPPTFRTLSIPGSAEDLAATVAALEPGRPVKLKLGSGDADRDVAFARAVRDGCGAILCIDANGAWSIPEAVGVLPALAELRVAFVEQPIAARDPDDWHLLRRLKSGTWPALFADESVRDAEDVIALAGAADGVNLKLAKCGGIEAVRQLAGLARSLDLGVMLGCMVESSLAVGAAAHLAPLADWVDLDAPYLIRDDPFTGLGLDGPVVRPPDAPGIGVTPTGPTA